ncbi:MAG TPA: aromatic amino acid ammonia-lyase [Steroidobacteraceae bacterium]|nr:aromatic amino acid ammonia-lyase [Steroidobacteraceae bacterium]
MPIHPLNLSRPGFGALAACAVLAAAGAVAAPSPPYRPITPTLADRTVVLDGRHLTIGEVVDVARYGAKVALSPEARQRSADAYGLLLEAAAEGVPVYWFNRGSGAARQREIFSGDPSSQGNKRLLLARQLANFRRGALTGLGPAINDEALVRAMMVVRANTMTYEAASPGLTQRLLDLLNDRITPVVLSRGTVGEGDLGPLANVAATMVGAGDAYYHGARMPAAQALKRAGLAPLAPFGADDSALESSNAYFTGQAALMLVDARKALSWADLTYAIDLNGMNSSVSPLALPVQENRPFKWVNWDAARVLDMMRGSYLFNLDERRIIQDPESLRASAIRQGSAWEAWAQLRDDLLIQLNSSDHNPAIRVGSSPGDSWELSTPQLLQFYVKGGPLSHGEHGYILSNANWDPYPIANEVEAFTIALANMDVAVAQRILRFTEPFFTVIAPLPVMQGEPRHFGAPYGGDIDSAALMQDIDGLINPVPPEGNALFASVEDLQAQTRLTIARARRTVADTVDLLAEDLLTGTYWLDMRKLQDSSRAFGPAPTAVWIAFRRAVPFAADTGPPLTRPPQRIAADFIRTHSADTFYGGDSQAAGPPDRRHITE